MAQSLDLLLKTLHQPGPYLIFIYTLIFLNDIPISMNHLAMAFYGSKSAFFCLYPAPGLSNQNTTSSDYFALSNSSDQSLSTRTSFYEMPNQTVQLRRNETNFETTKCVKGINSACDSWSFKLLPREKTIISEWDLVCDHAYLASLATTLYFAGVMVGGVIAGFFGDYFGRKPVMLATLYLSVPVGVGTAFMPTYGGFVTLRFVQGALMQGLQASSYSLLMEISRTKHRAYLTAFFELFFALGLIVLSFMAYMIRDWRYIQLAISLPSVLTIPYIWVIPESPRWLLTKNRISSVHAFFGRLNRTSVEPAEITTYVQELRNEMTSQSHRKYTVFDLLKTPRLRHRSAVLFFIWLVTALGYYGLSLSITDMAGNKYLNFLIASLVEVPAYSLALYVLNRFGRKRPLMLYFACAGVSCIVAGVIPTHTDRRLKMLTTAFALFGKFNMAGAFSVIFLYASEIYPTVMRNVGLGMCAVWLRIGAVIAPQLLLLSTYTVTWLPIVIFGSLALGASIATAFLPETLNSKLPDTVEQAERIKYKGHEQPSNEKHEVNGLMTTELTGDAAVS